MHARDLSDGAQDVVELLHVGDLHLERAHRSFAVRARVRLHDVHAHLGKGLAHAREQALGSSPITRRVTDRLDSPWTSQATSTRRSGSVSIALRQPCTWTVTPRPRVMKPTIGSPGTGAQHFP